MSDFRCRLLLSLALWAGCGGRSTAGRAADLGLVDAMGEPSTVEGGMVRPDAGVEPAPDADSELGLDATADDPPRDAVSARDVAVTPDGGGVEPLADAGPTDASAGAPDASLEAAADWGIDAPLDALADAPADAAPDGPTPAPNIGEWCDPALSDGTRDNPACLGGTKCLVIAAPTDGMCVIFGCSVDLPTDPQNEESCGPTLGAAYVCVDLDGEAYDPAEPYDPPASPDGQNASLGDNVCLRKCTPKDGANDCASEFACAPDSTRLHFDGAVCYFLACGGGADCPVTVAPVGSCVLDLECDTASGEFCTGVQDLDGDGTLEVHACALAGVCNPQNGLCDPHTMGSGTSVGDPCAFDAQCPDGGTCVLEAPVYDSLGAVVTRAPRNGTCTKLGCRFAGTLTSAGCPAGTECNHNYYAGGCQPACDVTDPWGCRNHDCNPGTGLTAGCDWFGDFDCYDWSGWTFSNGLPMISGPTGIVCDYDGPVFNTCEDMWVRTGGIGCPGVAPAANPAGMDCWYFESATPAASATDPAGRCLDTTTSGPACSDYGQLCDGVCVDTGGGPCP